MEFPSLQVDDDPPSGTVYYTNEYTVTWTIGPPEIGDSIQIPVDAEVPNWGTVKLGKVMRVTTAQKSFKVDGSTMLIKVADYAVSWRYPPMVDLEHRIHEAVDMKGPVIATVVKQAGDIDSCVNMVRGTVRVYRSSSTPGAAVTVRVFDAANVELACFPECTADCLEATIRSALTTTPKPPKDNDEDEEKEDRAREMPSTKAKETSTKEPSAGPSEGSSMGSTTQAPLEEDTALQSVLSLLRERMTTTRDPVDLATDWWNAELPKRMMADSTKTPKQHAADLDDEFLHKAEEFRASAGSLEALVAAHTQLLSAIENARAVLAHSDPVESAAKRPRTGS